MRNKLEPLGKNVLNLILVVSLILTTIITIVCDAFYFNGFYLDGSYKFFRIFGIHNISDFHLLIDGMHRNFIEILKIIPLLVYRLFRPSFHDLKLFYSGSISAIILILIFSSIAVLKYKSKNRSDFLLLIPTLSVGILALSYSDAQILFTIPILTIIVILRDNLTDVGTRIATHVLTLFLFECHQIVFLFACIIIAQEFIYLTQPLKYFFYRNWSLFFVGSWQLYFIIQNHKLFTTGGSVLAVSIIHPAMWPYYPLPVGIVLLLLLSHYLSKYNSLIFIALIGLIILQVYVTCPKNECNFWTFYDFRNEIAWLWLFALVLRCYPPKSDKRPSRSMDKFIIYNLVIFIIAMSSHVYIANKYSNCWRMIHSIEATRGAGVYSESILPKSNLRTCYSDWNLDITDILTTTQPTKKIFITTQSPGEFLARFYKNEFNLPWGVTVPDTYKGFSFKPRI
jgi:hypothetical protein